MGGWRERGREGGVLDLVARRGGVGGDGGGLGGGDGAKGDGFDAL